MFINGKLRAVAISMDQVRSVEQFKVVSVFEVGQSFFHIGIFSSFEP